tara:strand:- start:796 stop:1317 length:522 start_codon:yes stop_codon:yes gene_type:complete
MRCLLITAALLPGLAAAHPHGTVDQQLNLSLGRDKAELTWTIAPPAEQAGHILAHLDSDGDGIVTVPETAAFMDALLAATRLTVNGEAVTLAQGDLTEMAPTGSAGLIKLTAIADMPQFPTTPAVVSVEISYTEFAEEWFIQPFYFEDLSEGPSPRIERAPNALSVSLPPKTR